MSSRTLVTCDVCGNHATIQKEGVPAGWRRVTFSGGCWVAVPSREAAGDEAVGEAAGDGMAVTLKLDVCSEACLPAAYTKGEEHILRALRAGRPPGGAP